MSFKFYLTLSLGQQVACPIGLLSRAQLTGVLTSIEILQEQKPAKVAQVAAASLAALFIFAAPSMAVDKALLKSKVCAAQPTAKICLRDSVKK